jgi:predicted membrane protein
VLSRRRKLLILLAGITLLAFVAGKVLAIAGLIILLPIYALLLASIFLIVAVVIGIIVVPVGQLLAERYEEKRKPAPQIQKEEPEGRKAA